MKRDITYKFEPFEAKGTQMPTKDETVVATIPELHQFLNMAKPGTAPADQFFVYWVSVPCCCDNAFPRVARQTKLTVLSPLMIEVEFVTELYSDSDNPGDEQHYANGVMVAKFDKTDVKEEAIITLDHDSVVKCRHELFAKRPEFVTIGA